ncbi:unnamed protein product [Rodentolepis nana]|uniref:Phtf-FEM1B_bdg domain-containing protein n=1 Tax=Rodentolepis nana TaxID=102285 RepID=A0A158QI32_RODNA|nr:unnamed protein product [Rodentolepis nana]
MTLKKKKKNTTVVVYEKIAPSYHCRYSPQSRMGRRQGSSSRLPQNEADSNANGSISKRPILSPKEEERPKGISGEHDSIEPLDLDEIKEESESKDQQDEDEEDGNDEPTEGEALEGGPEEADVDDNDFDEDDVEVNETFMANRRQRANFYKIFVQRATYHRYHNQRSKGGEDAQALIKSNLTPPESLSVLQNSKNTSNSNLTIVIPGRRGSNVAQKRTSVPSGRTKNVNFMKKNSPVESSKWQIAKTQGKVCTALPNPHFAFPSCPPPPPPPARPPPRNLLGIGMATASAVAELAIFRLRLVTSCLSKGHPASETEYERMNSDVRSDETTSGSDDEQSVLREHASRSHRTNTSTTGSPTLAAGKTGSKRLKKLSVRTVGLTEDGSPSSTPSSVLGIHSTASPSEEKAGWTGSTEVNGLDAPFALWYFHTIQGMSDPSYSQSESVSCYVWEGKHMRKISFTLLDIGWRIIQVAVVIVLFLTILPLFFHTLNQSTPNRPYNASVQIGPLPEFEIVANITNPFKTPGTLVLYLYHKIADFVTHLWFQTRQGVWDDVLRVATLVFLLRFLTLGLKITKKFRNVSVLISEQLNLHLCMNRKPQKKDELTTTNQVLRMAESLLKEVDGPYRICGWAVNPLIYNIFKLVLLSCFSAFISEILGFKLKLYKLKLNPANW